MGGNNLRNITKTKVRELITKAGFLLTKEEVSTDINNNYHERFIFSGKKCTPFDKDKI